MENGLVRPIDKMGRVVIPKEYRDQMKVKNDVDSFEIYLEGDKIILKKYQPGCIFCGEVLPSVSLNGNSVCKKCIERLNEIKEQIK